MAIERIDWQEDDPRWFGCLTEPLSFWHHIPWLYAGNREFDRATYLSCFRFLLERCGPNSIGGFTRTALHEVAAMGEHVTEEEAAAFALALLDAGARMDVRDDILKKRAPRLGLPVGPRECGQGNVGTGPRMSSKRMPSLGPALERGPGKWACRRFTVAQQSRRCRVTKLTRRSMLGVATATALAALPHKRPNLLFVLTDSWRGQALPSAGDPNLVAPNLARLAREGAYCSRAYTSYPVCCPSRSAILTGKFPHAAGVVHNHSLLPLGQETMSAVLKRAGYRTGYIGKWHLDGAASPGFVPPGRRRGFDYWAANNVDHRHYDSVYFRDDPAAIQIRGFASDDQTDLAIEFLRQTSGEPFYLYLSFLAPHAPLTPPARHAI